MAGQNYGDSDPSLTQNGSTDTVDPTKDNNGQQSWQDALARRNAQQQNYPIDPANGLHYDIQNGQKLYFEPIETPEQYLARIAQEGHGGLTGSDQYTWNQKTGKYENDTDWLKVAALVAGGADAAAIAAGAAGAGATSGIADQPTLAQLGATGSGADAAGTSAFGASALTPATTASPLGTLPAAGTDLASTSTVGTAALPGAGGTVAGMGTGGGVLSTVGKVLTNKGVDGVLGAVGNGLANATNAATNNRYGAADQNIKGNQAYETELMNRSKTEADQRNQAEKDAYRQSWYANRQPGPYDPRPLTPISDAYQQTLNNLGAQANKKLANGATYDSSQWSDLKPYQPSQPGTLEQVGSWLSPILTGLGAAYKGYTQ